MGNLSQNSLKIQKRIFDVSLAVMLVIFLIPVYIVMYIAVKTTSKGPAIYTQERIGVNGKRFYIYKFRSMKIDAESTIGPVISLINDNRVTPIGKFIRSIRLDETPQLYNVIRGDMSLVGPRPERPYFVRQHIKSLPRYAERQSVKPGITGLAQINFDSHYDVKKKLEHDLEYINNYSMLNDVKIMISTSKIVWIGIREMVKYLFNELGFIWHKTMLESLTFELQAMDRRHYHAIRMDYHRERLEKNS